MHGVTGRRGGICPRSQPLDEKLKLNYGRFLCVATGLGLSKGNPIPVRKISCLESTQRMLLQQQQLFVFAQGKPPG